MDYATPIGKLVRGILMQVAEFEVEQLSQRTKEGQAKAIADGKKIGRRRVEVNIPKAKDLLAQGLSKEKVAKMLGTNTGTLNRRLKECS
jgi:DNA invertase Pin-like site-specific DNA recombinase